VADVMAVCNMEMQLAVGSIGRDAGLEAVCGRREAGAVSARPQRVMVSAKVEQRWPAARVVARRARFRCSASSGDAQPKKVRVSFHAFLVA
jgi:hypothetical protein